MRGLSFIIISLFLGSAQANNCIAHRGDNENFMENSLESLKGAMDVKAHGIEFDLQHTSDGIALLMHDKRLRRTAMNKPGKSCPLKTKIKKLTLKEIKENCLLKNGSPIPTLEEAFDFLGDYPGHLFIELKDSPSHKTLDLIAERRTGKEEKTRFISFKKRYLKKAQKLQKIYPLYGEIKMLNINVWWPFPGKELGLDISKWGQRFLYWARKMKREIGIWTVDKVSSMRALFKRKIPFVTTNRITACMELSKAFDVRHEP